MTTAATKLPVSDAAWRKFAQMTRRDYLLSNKNQLSKTEKMPLVATSSQRFTETHRAADPKAQADYAIHQLVQRVQPFRGLRPLPYAKSSKSPADAAPQ